MKKKTTRDKKLLTVILLGENGFSRRMKLPAANLPITINVPFLYRIRITSPVVGDYFDLDLTPVGKFVLQKRTKTTATYRLLNLYQAQPTPTTPSPKVEGTSKQATLA
jgi:hypothetical protein